MVTRSKKALDEDDDDERPSHTCVVYDPKTGRVAHVHEFIGKGFKKEECERMALATVASLGHVKATGLKVLHPSGVKLDRNTMLRVNPKSLEIVTAVRPIRRRRAK